MRDSLARDPRTMWAYRCFTGRRSPEDLGEDCTVTVLGALEPEEHAEFIGWARLEEGRSLLRAPSLQRSGAHHLAIRTVNSWFLVDTDSLELSPRLLQRGLKAFTPRATKWPDIGWATVGTDPSGEDVVFKTFVDSEHCLERRVLDHGAATVIKRLPPSALALPVPDLAELPVRPAEPERAASLLTDWRSAEEAAQAHMMANGFPDALLTGGGRDSGIDITAGTGVAQVKMQALPVGATAVQQLRGARPSAPYHLFYSTSGYTAAAVDIGDDIGVALFRVGADGAVVGVNAHARAAMRSTAVSAEPVRMTTEEALSDYTVRVQHRVRSAARRLDAAAASRQAPASDRSLDYMRASLASFARPSTFPSASAAVAYYHHAELLAITAFRGLSVEYPEGDAEQRAPEPTLEDYYDL